MAAPPRMDRELQILREAALISMEKKAALAKARELDELREAALSSARERRISSDLVKGKRRLESPPLHHYNRRRDMSASGSQDSYDSEDGGPTTPKMSECDSRQLTPPHHTEPNLNTVFTVKMTDKMVLKRQDSDDSLTITSPILPQEENKKITIKLTTEKLPPICDLGSDSSSDSNTQTLDKTVLYDSDGKAPSNGIDKHKSTDTGKRKDSNASNNKDSNNKDSTVSNDKSEGDEDTDKSVGKEQEPGSSPKSEKKASSPAFSKVSSVDLTLDLQDLQTLPSRKHKKKHKKHKKTTKSKSKKAKHVEVLSEGEERERVRGEERERVRGEERERVRGDEQHKYPLLSGEEQHKYPQPLTSVRKSSRNSHHRPRSAKTETNGISPGRKEDKIPESKLEKKLAQKQMLSEIDLAIDRNIEYLHKIKRQKHDHKKEPSKFEQKPKKRTSQSEADPNVDAPTKKERRDSETKKSDKVVESKKSDPPKSDHNRSISPKSKDISPSKDRPKRDRRKRRDSDPKPTPDDKKRESDEKREAKRELEKQQESKREFEEQLVSLKSKREFEQMKAEMNKIQVPIPGKKEDKSGKKSGGGRSQSVADITEEEERELLGEEEKEVQKEETPVPDDFVSVMKEDSMSDSDEDDIVNILTDKKLSDTKKKKPKKNKKKKNKDDKKKKKKKRKHSEEDSCSDDSGPNKKPKVKIDKSELNKIVQFLKQRDEQQRAHDGPKNTFNPKIIGKDAKPIEIKIKSKPKR